MVIFEMRIFKGKQWIHCGFSEPYTVWNQGIMPELQPLNWSLLGSVTCLTLFPVMGYRARQGSLAHVIHGRSY